MHGDPQEAAGVHEGQILASKYRVEKVLGIGGMGVVVAAQHVRLDEKVAIKFLLPGMLGNKEVVGRFAREARAAVKIKSEHVARVFDVGTLENGAPYMVMEFLEGDDLAAWLRQRGPLPIEQAVDFVLQACVGVASAHGIGIVHRDLKPANLFCLRGNDGQFIIKVLDFGISKLTDVGGSQEGMSATKTAAVMGSPLYMSPEQMQSAKDVDGQTDIWALGIVLYELLTGTRPFVGESFAEIAIKVATTSFAGVRTCRPDVPPELDAVILKCLQKDKKRRYTNVAELALALSDFGSKRARPSIERIVGIIQAAGLSTSALALPASPKPAPVNSETDQDPAGSRVASGTMTALQPAPGILGPLGTMAPSANTAPGVARRPKTLAVVGIAGTLSVAALIGLVVWSKHQSDGAAISPVTSGPALVSSALPVNAIVSEPAGTAESAVEASTTPPTAASPPPAVVPNIPPTAKPVTAGGPALGKTPANAGLHPPRPTPSPAPLPAPSPPTVTGAKPNCNPNFTWGPNGNKIFKPECF